MTGRRTAVVGVALVACMSAACSSGSSPKTHATTTAAVAPVITAATVPTADLVANASHVTDLLIAGKWADAIAVFDPLLSARFDAASLKTAWDSVTAAYGAYKSRQPTTEVAGAYETPMLFGSTHVTSRVTFDPEGKVSDLRIVKA